MGDVRDVSDIAYRLRARACPISGLGAESAEPWRYREERYNLQTETQPPSRLSSLPIPLRAAAEYSRTPTAKSAQRAYTTLQSTTSFTSRNNVNASNPGERTIVATPADS